MSGLYEPEIEEELLTAAIAYAREAGEQILRRMKEPYALGDKVNRSDLVTEVDLHSENLIRSRIGCRYPDHWILSEEQDGSRDCFRFIADPPPGYGWIVDPIDGTVNFVHGIPHFAVSIGIVKDGSPLHGVVYNPATDELYQASRGGGAYLNGNQLRADAEGDLACSLLATGFQASDWRKDSVAASQVARVAGVSRSVRVLGAASLDLCHVASGRLTGFWHDGLYPWDVAAGMLILQESGGVVSNAGGEPFALHDKTLVASNPSLQPGLLSLLFT
ncbi:MULTISPECIES: inositol monophosphatase family protein [unclassified Paenibacillus]|uniref:inositol monophosphatase family protein n=1 Tax=unclassified Paenibacillus TaxID=185978 RepID=UPI000956AC93|nr:MULTISPECIES: inositol monophosphatase family protein [unclassified Paenibacillus]ASS65435.2 inositol monophosphatase [Paenibacillus sp. RUD330]SIQ36332.1 myo-inositol-1(or 4)-monophosphatase [Paenibacillus sp. RU4X]SIQ58375.1 myo-inositol-1(or 4)-monophosphatase [Paenibacillus sp. RU4T]